MAQPGKVTQLSDLDANWDFNITNRLDAMSFERAFDLFAEQLRPAAISHWGFHAAFTWPGEERLPLVMTETLVIATDSGLSEATHLAATILPNAQLHTKPDIKRAVFEQAAGTIADETIDWLDR